jgi:hypothetical protein
VVKYGIFEGEFDCVRSLHFLVVWLVARRDSCGQITLQNGGEDGRDLHYATKKPLNYESEVDSFVALCDLQNQ